MKFTFTFLLLCIFKLIPAFPQSANNRYHEIDSIAHTIDYDGDLHGLVSGLTKNYNSQLEKARAIYAWITYNIAYDYKYLNKKQVEKFFHCSGEKADCDHRYNKWEDDYIEKTLRSKKAICFGYSTLFKRMCGYAGIQCSIISGYVKNEPAQVGRMGVLDHAWNAIKINESYYFIDCTWAAGYCLKNEKNKYIGFIRAQEDYYWLTPADKLLRNHYPDDDFWAELAGPAEAYKNTPYILPQDLPNLEVITPKSGILAVKVGDTLHFAIKYSEDINKLQINSNLYRNPPAWIITDNGPEWNSRNEKKQKYIAFNHSEGIYTFDYVVEKDYLRFIDILFDYDVILHFKCVETDD